MKTERDFTEVQLKANASGSWMNVLTCKSEDCDAVKRACETLANAARGAARGRLKFKLLDAAGGELERLVDWQGWKEARK